MNKLRPGGSKRLRRGNNSIKVCRMSGSQESSWQEFPLRMGKPPKHHRPTLWKRESSLCSGIILEVPGKNLDKDCREDKEAREVLAPPQKMGKKSQKEAQLDEPKGSLWARGTRHYSRRPFVSLEAR